jgi:hypothetical protein
MQLGIFLDREQVQKCQGWVNPTGIHMSLVPVLFTTGKQPAGNHVMESRVVNGISAVNDDYNVTVVEPNQVTTCGVAITLFVHVRRCVHELTLAIKGASLF